jgi:hypothetical protein
MYRRRKADRNDQSICQYQEPTRRLRMNNKIFIRALSLTMLFGVTCCSTCPTSQRVTIETFALNLPRNVDLVKQYEMEDFCLYRCSVGGERILDFYIGNAPDFPQRKDAVSRITHATLGGMGTENIQLGSKREVSREVLVTLPSGEWPRFAHFWYFDLDQQRSELADFIINSIKVNSAKGSPINVSGQ